MSGCIDVEADGSTLVRIAEVEKDDVMNVFYIMNVWYYGYAFCFHPGYLLCHRRLHALESLTNNQVKMRIDKSNNVVNPALVKKSQKRALCGYMQIRRKYDQAPTLTSPPVSPSGPSV